MTNQKKFLNGLIRWLPLVGLVLFFGLILWGYSRGIFHSGLIIGEFIGFLLVRYYGRSFVKIILSPNKYKKFEEILDKNEHNVKKLLIFTMLVPFAPDDIVCLVAGITDISLKEFMKIVLLLKFWSVATYSYLMLYLFQLFGKL